MIKTVLHWFGIAVGIAFSVWLVALGYAWLFGLGKFSSPSEPKPGQQQQKTETQVQPGGGEKKFAPIAARQGGTLQVTPMAQEWARECADRPYTRAWREPIRYRCRGEEGTITTIGGGETIIRGFGR